MKRAIPEGSTVKFFHERWSTEQEDGAGVILPRGGMTVCKLVLSNGTEITARAECSERDNYNKKIGRDISLGRALATAERLHPEAFRKAVTA